MQRWIVGGVLAVLLLCGGLGFAYLTYKQNRPSPMWVPVPIRADLETAKRDAIIKEIKAKLSSKEVLRKVSKDVGLVHKWKLESDDEGARVIGNRLFVRAGEADTKMGKVPAILIGVTGKYKEREVSGEIAARLMDDVWKILGIDPPKRKKD